MYNVNIVNICKILVIYVLVVDELTQVGGQLEDQSKVDDDDTSSTYIDQEPFTKPGTLQAIEVMACATGKPFKVGIYRPTTSNTQCSYRLMGELSFSSLSKFGYNKVMVH
jgi:hypothetical protein